MEPANFPEIYTGNGDESDRMQDIAGCFDPIIPRNDGFQYDIEAAASDVCHGKDKWKLPILPVAPGKIIPGRSARPPSPAPGRKNHPRPEGLRYFSRKPCLSGSVCRKAHVVQRAAKARVSTIKMIKS